MLADDTKLYKIYRHDDDDMEIQRKVCENLLKRLGYRIHSVSSGEEAIEYVKYNPVDLIVLDLMLPGIDGLEVARRLKQKSDTMDTPIVMLTAKGEASDRIRGLDMGADDYIVKPFSVKELKSRIQAVLRRSIPENQAVQIGELFLDPVSQRVKVGDKSLDLPPTEFRLLHYFMTHEDRVFTRGQLLDQVWGQQVYVEERTVDVHVRRLRKALSEHGVERYIQTVRGAGYRFSILDG